MSVADKLKSLFCEYADVGCDTSPENYRVLANVNLERSYTPEGSNITYYAAQTNEINPNLRSNLIVSQNEYGAVQVFNLDNAIIQSASTGLKIREDNGILASSDSKYGVYEYVVLPYALDRNDQLKDNLIYKDGDPKPTMFLINNNLNDKGQITNRASERFGHFERISKFNVQSHIRSFSQAILAADHLGVDVKYDIRTQVSDKLLTFESEPDKPAISRSNGYTF